ncbi:MAG: hypothetical protein FJY85_03425 [Deltaproteobacteria bacterium]|nr:hypothetical protein [Deltaproteobacteria bacterium]
MGRPLPEAYRNIILLAYRNLPCLGHGQRCLQRDLYALVFRACYGGRRDHATWVSVSRSFKGLCKKRLFIKYEQKKGRLARYRLSAEGLQIAKALAQGEVKNASPESNVLR